jgi:hypothetical protein
MLLEKNNSKKDTNGKKKHISMFYAKSLFSMLASISCSLEFRNIEIGISQ